MRFQLTAAVLGVISLVGASASAFPLLHRHHHHTTYVIQNQPAPYVAPAQPQVNVQVSPQYDAPRGGGPALDDHQMQEQQQLREHQMQEQQDLQNHQMREAYPQY